MKYVTLGGGGGGGGGVGVSAAKRYMGMGVARGGGEGYLADRYVTLILNLICLVFSLSIERFVQLRRVPIMRYE